MLHKSFQYASLLIDKSFDTSTNGSKPSLGVMKTSGLGRQKQPSRGVLR